MKKVILNLFAFAAIAIGFTSCSDDDDGCHECHVAYMVGTDEVSVDIGEFCGSALDDVEAPNYLHSIETTIVGLDTVPAGDYPVHCEDHGDHDDH